MMLDGKTPSADVTMDAELRGWLEATTDEVRDVIVEASLPPRRVVFQRRLGAAPIPKSIDAGDDSDRESLLHELDHQLRDIVGAEKTHVLKAAGAIVVQATADELRAIAKQPMVKAIRANRRFG
jgi:hypothetical protein